VDGVLEQLRSIRQLHLILDVLAVCLDRLDAQVQLAGDLPGRNPTPDQLEHLDLAIAQLAYP
jgi:hypothetical protein